DLIAWTTYPAISPAASAPRNPALTDCICLICTATPCTVVTSTIFSISATRPERKPPIIPGTSPGLPAIEYAMYPARIGSITPKHGPQIWSIKFSTGPFDAPGALFAPLGANPSAPAIRIPPHATNGIANDPPVNRCCRSFLSHSIDEPSAAAPGRCVCPPLLG